jgi:hypothetical protein
MTTQRRIGELEDELKQRDRRITELRQEIDEQGELITSMRENIEDSDNVLESWRDTFDMTMTDDGAWTWKPFWNEHNKLVDRYESLRQRWNKYVPLINGRAQPVGRPLAASDDQADTVRKLHTKGMSLRDIMIETNLSFSTVRTIVGQINRTDRTTKKHRDRFERIERDKARDVRWKRQKRTGDALPKRAQAVFDKGRALIVEAKGLGKR